MDVIDYADQNFGNNIRRILVKFKWGIHDEVAQRYLKELNALRIESDKNGAYIVTVEATRAPAWARRCAASPMVSLVTFSPS